MGYTKRVNRSKGKGRSRSRARSRRGGMFKAINNSLKSMVDGMDWRENPLSQAEKGRSLSPPNFPPSVNTTPLTEEKLEEAENQRNTIKKALLQRLEKEEKILLRIKEIKNITEEVIVNQNLKRENLC